MKVTRAEIASAVCRLSLLEQHLYIIHMRSEHYSQPVDAKSVFAFRCIVSGAF